MDYEFPGTSAFAQLRRGLPVVAAVLFVAALLFPMWRIEVHAVQYPSTVLELQLYAYPRITGDYVEMANLNKYIGFYYPDPVYWQPNFEPHPGPSTCPSGRWVRWRSSSSRRAASSSRSRPTCGDSSADSSRSSRGRRSCSACCSPTSSTVSTRRDTRSTRTRR